MTLQNVWIYHSINFENDKMEIVWWDISHNGRNCVPSKPNSSNSVLCSGITGYIWRKIGNHHLESWTVYYSNCWIASYCLLFAKPLGPNVPEKTCFWNVRDHLLSPISGSRHRFWASRLSPFNSPWDFTLKQWSQFYPSSIWKFFDFGSQKGLYGPFRGLNINLGRRDYHYSIRREILP